jgi:hypothetical protein
LQSQSNNGNGAVIAELVRILKKKINDNSIDKFLAALRETNQEFIANRLAEQLSARSTFNEHSVD